VARKAPSGKLHLLKTRNMASVLRPEHLRDQSGYSLIRVLRHDEIIEFVVDQIRQLRWPMIFFYGTVLVLFLMMVAFTAGNFAYNYFAWSVYWKYLALGVISGMLLVIPFHELLHGLAYKLAGAGKIKYGADLKQLLFYASAPGFVAGRSAFYMVAFSPFLILNLLFISGITWGPAAVQWGSLVALFVHSTMCIGDFAMVNFFAAFPKEKIYTYDEEGTGISYFYKKRT
jgi:hypothetical protein